MTNKIVEKYFDNLAGEWDSYQECPADVKRALLGKIGIERGAHVLDVACGTGAITAQLHDITGEKVRGVDLSGEMIAVARRKFAGCDWAEFERIDFLDMPEDEVFTDIVIYNAYPHFLDPCALAKKGARTFERRRKTCNRSFTRQKHSQLSPQATRRSRLPSARRTA